MGLCALRRVSCRGLCSPPFYFGALSALHVVEICVVASAVAVLSLRASAASVYPIFLMGVAISPS